MIYEEIPIQIRDSQPYAKLQCYIWSHSSEIPIDLRPLILILPGGGYHLTTDREAEPVALHFMALGYHVAVLRYSVAPARWPLALNEVKAAGKRLLPRWMEWFIDPGRIILLGFSAGGHLAASYAEYWKKIDGFRPAGLILGYPVISSDPAIWHEGSFRQLLGEKLDDPHTRDMVSLEKHVNADVPPVFIWNTKTDDTVPAANSEVFVKALKEQGIPVEYHEYPTGGHGLSLANELSDNVNHQCYWKACQDWVDYAGDWLKERFPIGKGYGAEKDKG